MHIAHETAGAARTRSSLRPLFSRRDNEQPKLGQSVSRESKRTSSRHSGARLLARTRNPFRHLLCRSMDSGFALCAPRNDEWSDVTLPQPQLIIPLRRDLIALGAIGRRAAAVAGDDAGLLALDVGIDAGHPGIDLVGQQPLAKRLDVIGPGLNALRRRLQPR